MSVHSPLPGSEDDEVVEEEDVDRREAEAQAEERRPLTELLQLPLLLQLSRLAHQRDCLGILWDGGAVRVLICRSLVREDHLYTHLVQGSQS